MSSGRVTVADRFFNRRLAWNQANYRPLAAHGQ
jgi:hypothetical protein